MIAYKTRADQRLDRLSSLNRPLTEAESDELRRSLHAVYCRDRRSNALAQHETEEKALLKRMEAEAKQPEHVANRYLG